MPETRPRRYEYQTRKNYRDAVAAWIKKWKLWRQSRRKKPKS